MTIKYPANIQGRAYWLRAVLGIARIFFVVIILGKSNVILANPEGGVVSAGSAAIVAPLSSNTTTILQASDKAVIDWRSFNISANETTNFVQPSAQSMLLNRVDSAQGMSTISGKLSANGQIFILNQAGILFGAGAIVDVAGLIASSATISNADFMSGHYNFTNGQGAVINEGTIRIADGGFAALLAPGVANRGTIEANLGEVVLASGKDFTVDFYGDKLINFDATGEATAMPNDKNGQPMRDAVSNTGTIIADGGKVLLSANAVEDIVDHVINTSGYIQANSVGVHNGEIILSGGAQGVVRVSGHIEASGKVSGETGGKIKILGEKVGLVDNAQVIAQGAAGGGEILIGGNLRGGGVEQNSRYTYVGQNVKVDASALNIGNGGRIIVWSDSVTLFSGKIFARGGEVGGNGGFVETSSKGYLSVNGGTVDLRAPYGKTGDWLLDPTNIFIAVDQESATAAGMSGIDSSANIGNDGIPEMFSASGVVQDSLLTTNSLEIALNTANVIVTTSNTSGTGVGNITVVDPITWTSGNSLTLTAANKITINAAITAVNGGDITLTAENISELPIALFVNGNLSTGTNGTGILTIDGGVAMNAPVVNLGSGNITLNGNGNYITLSNLTVNGQTILQNANLATGVINTGALTIINDDSHLTGTVGGMSGAEAARRVHVVGGAPGRDFFNGFDLSSLSAVTESVGEFLMDLFDIEDPDMSIYELEERPEANDDHQRVCSAG